MTASMLCYTHCDKQHFKVQSNGFQYNIFLVLFTYCFLFTSVFPNLSLCLSQQPLSVFISYTLLPFVLPPPHASKPPPQAWQLTPSIPDTWLPLGAFMPSMHFSYLQNRDNNDTSCDFLKINILAGCGQVHAFTLSILEEEAGRSLWVWYQTILSVTGKPGLQSETGKQTNVFSIPQYSLK